MAVDRGVFDGWSGLAAEKVPADVYHADDHRGPAQLWRKQRSQRYQQPHALDLVFVAPANGCRVGRPNSDNQWVGIRKLIERDV
jgi:hypothetical protein